MVIEMMELMQKETEFSSEIPGDKISHLIVLDRGKKLKKETLLLSIKHNIYVF